MRPMRNLVWMVLFVLAFGFVAGWIVAEPVLALRWATATAVVSQAGGEIASVPQAPARAIRAGQ
jgi:hypothetical protein